MPFGLSYSHLGPQLIWKSPWLDWKSLFIKLHRSSFLSSNFDNVLSTFFVDHLDGKLALLRNLLKLSNSLVDSNFTWKIPSLDWISLFMKLNKCILIFELEIRSIKYFFRRPPKWKIISVSEPTRIITFLRRPSIQLNKSFTRLKIAFHETAQEYFLSSNFDNLLSTFFVDHLDGKLALFHNLRWLSH